MTDLQEELKQFTGGTEHWYRHHMNRKVTYTDGVKYLAEKAGAYWLVDDICAAYQIDTEVRSVPFQVWKLEVNQDDHTAVLRLEDGNDNLVKSYDITFTDFPLTEIILWFTDNTLLLPCEY
ncbi:DUF6876 family protein [Lewinella sp. LCG006]|uniref:DUF6876 family protein n=1 Tax=Lewinella sp. LCG006 TaxID=3231911 RepID=UPI0034609DED